MYKRGRSNSYPKFGPQFGTPKHTSLTTSCISELEWKQSTNPLLAHDQQMNPTDARLMPMDREPTLFDGLSLSSDPRTFLDGNVGIYWWYSVVYAVAYYILPQALNYQNHF